MPRQRVMRGCRPVSRGAGVGLVLAVAWAACAWACTNVLVSRGASASGSTFVTYSCDGGIFASVAVVPGGVHPAGTELDVFADAAGTSGRGEPPEVKLGRIAQPERTYRYIDVRGGTDFYHLGGVNEHGVAIAETTLVGTRPALRNDRGLLAPFSACPARSLMTLALARASTAREAVLVIGELAERYGYASPFPIDGEQFAISDGTEAWSMEIFGAGRAWAPDCGRPGAVWCAQRVPDGHVAVSANRSRIGRIDLARSDQFLASPNVHSLAIDMGWWDPDAGEPFVWCDAYAPSDRWSSAIREWRVLSLAAPSLHLQPGDRLPFSVRAERALSTADVMEMQRDLLVGTPYDVTASPAFAVAGQPSPLATPQGSSALYQLLHIEPDRTISSRHASFSCIYETQAARPAAMRACAWFGFGPAATSCYLPIYSGTTEVPDRWSRTDLARGDASLPFWTMTYPGHLAATRWQVAYPELVTVRSPAEAAFLVEERRLVARIGHEADGGSLFLNALLAARAAAVEEAFIALAEFLRVSCLTELAVAVSCTAPTVEIPQFADAP